MAKYWRIFGIWLMVTVALQISALGWAGQEGTPKWSYITNGHVKSSPAIGDDGIVYFSSGYGDLYAIKPDGLLKWSLTTSGTTGQMDASPTIGPDGTVYAGSGGPHLYAVNPDGTLKWDYHSLYRL